MSALVAEMFCMAAAEEAAVAVITADRKKDRQERAPHKLDHKQTDISNTHTS
jgi:hypothetical protein